MPTLAELRAQTGPAPLPRTSKYVTLIEGQHLLAESEKLAEELRDIALTVVGPAGGTDADGERTGPPLKAGQAPTIPPRVEEIKAEQRALLDKLGDFQEEVGLVGITGGEWQRFKDENPARPDNAADQRLARGLCNSSALFAALGRFVATWKGEAVAPGEWDKWLGERICYGDRRDLVPAVVDMHEQAVGLSPKLRTSSSTTETSEPD